ERLRSPSRFVKERKWDLPDQEFISEKEFTTLFPDEAWKDELNSVSWEVQEDFEVISIPPGSTNIDLQNVLQKEGVYRVIAEVVDEEMNVVIDTLYSTVYDPGGEIIPGQEAYWVAPIQESFEPGDTVEIWIGTHDSLWIWMDHSAAIGNRSSWRKYRGWNQLRIPVMEDDRGGIVVSLVSVFRNRFQSRNLRIEVPWTNKELEIEVTTWRNKMAPGDRDSFTITVHGEGMEDRRAELLLSMYDKSLDQFAPHQWQSDFYPVNSYWIQMRSAGFGTLHSRLFSTNWNEAYVPVPERIYPEINWFEWEQVFWGNPRYRSLDVMQEAAISAESEMGRGGDQSTEAISMGTNLTSMPIRENFVETLFFYPVTSIDSNGNANFQFIMNDAVTTWKFMAFAHTKDLAVGYKQLEMISQRPVMVLANMPRFLREGDSLRVGGRVVNLTDASQEVTASLNFLDFADSRVLNDKLIVSLNPQKLLLAPGESRPVFWQVTVPNDLGSNVNYHMMVRNDDFKDGESDFIPILPQRILVTEGIAFQTRGESKDQYDLVDLDRVLAGGHDLNSFELEHVSNPVWHVLSSLPYLIKYPHQCTEQIFNRYYAYQVGQHIVSANVGVQRMIKQWQRHLENARDESAYESQHNSVDIEETPWLEEMHLEQERIRQLEQLLNENQTDQGLYEAMVQLKQMQLPNGAFPWFKDGRENRYVTQYLLEGFGKLKELRLIEMNSDLEAMLSRASEYLDQQFLIHYEEIKRRARKGETSLEENHLNPLVVHYTYTRSFWLEDFMSEDIEEASAFYEAQMKRYWIGQSLYTQALIGFIAAANNDEDLLQQLLKSFSERVFRVANRAFWKESFGHSWEQLPLETHVALLRLFDKYADDKDLVEELKNHLLYHRRLNRWGSTKSTSDAIHAMLTTGQEWTDSVNSSKISVTGQKIEPELRASHPSGRWTKSLDSIPDRSKKQFIVIENPNQAPTWTGLTWTYNEELDKVKHTGTEELAVTKNIFLRRLTDSGKILKNVTEQIPKLGDQLVVELTIELKESMEFVYLKDLRATGLEPLDQVSGYRWKHGLGFYQSSDDLQASFFFDYLPRGKHVFQYPLRVAQTGSFAGGVATIQSMYAPEFIAHSAGTRLDFGN
ncbi:MAG: hypothetical protein OEM26_15565, partial [Saprospiraceae bacterium]|nr:hypothetical protein [Saprospiraceae bacterium]